MIDQKMIARVVGVVCLGLTVACSGGNPGLPSGGGGTTGSSETGGTTGGGTTGATTGGTTGGTTSGTTGGTTGATTGGTTGGTTGETTQGDGAIIGDGPVVEAHLDQLQIEAGEVPLEVLRSHGELLFTANFNTLDGAGRPEATGTGADRSMRMMPDNFNRISAPDANACSGCHNLPRSGGGGDNVANVFVLGQALPFVNFDGGEGDNFEEHTLTEVANERNTLGMFGAGYIELLAREMTVELHALRAEALARAEVTGRDTRTPLIAKGISFGAITAKADGTVDTSEVEGVDADLIIKPFHQKGAVISLREFANNAFNHHHGIQSSERFGDGVDHDGDGYTNELTVGDITAVAIYQAALPTPGRVLPKDPEAREAAMLGELLFTQIGCGTCHVPALKLDNPVFTEPNPFNPDGNLKSNEVEPYAFDLTTQGRAPRLPREADGSVIVPAFTDLKRHDMGPELNNERKVQAGIPTEMWLTRKLWGAANEPPYLHHGRATTITEAILAHGGEGEEARERFEALSDAEQNQIVEFLKTLQVLPEGETRLVID